jgi:Lysyl oxidase
VALICVGVSAVAAAALTQRGSDPIDFPTVATPTASTVAGVLRANGEALSEVRVRLGIDGQAFDADNAASTTDSEGGFVIEFPEGFDAATSDVFLEVTFDRDRNGDEIVGTVNVRRPVTPGELQHVIDVTAPERCDDDCDVLLPDLEPVISDVVVSETDPLPPESVYFDTTTLPGRRLMRFASLTANVGAGPLHMLGTEVDAEGRLSTTQRLWTSDMRFEDRVAGAFTYHEGHEHIHLEDFEEYRLVDANGAVVAESGKLSYCLLDSASVTDRPSADIDFGIYLGADCGQVEQAINPGFADYYGAGLPDQWIDVTGIEPDAYDIEIIADPSDFLMESDESNNSVSFPVVVPENDGG